MAVIGDYAYLSETYLGNGSGGLRILNVSNPTTPMEIGYYPSTAAIAGAEGVTVIGDYAYVVENYAYNVDGYSTLRVLDISNPSSPTSVGFYNFPGDAYRIVATGAYTYVGGGGFSEAKSGGGLRVFNISSETSSQTDEIGFGKAKGPG